jgi:predicted aspartyl protease
VGQTFLSAIERRTRRSIFPDSLSCVREPEADKNVCTTYALFVIFSLLFILTLLAGCVESPRFVPVSITRADADTSPLVIPVELPFRGIPMMQLGTEQNHFIAVLDTGAAANLVSPRWIERQGLKTRSVPNLRIVDAQGKKRPAPNVARVPALAIGGAVFHDFDVMVDDSVRAMHDRTDVMLGAPLFENVLLTIDYRRQRLLLESGASLPPINGQDILPLRKTDEGHLEIQAKLLGEEAWLVLDTGHTGQGLTLSRFRLIALPWASAPVETGTIQTMLGTHALRAGRMDGDISLGRFTLHRPIVSIGFTDNDELIGADTLQHFVVTIDQKNNRIRLEPNDTANVIIFPPVRRLGFTVTNRTGTLQVTPGTFAAKAGLQSGDVLLSVNDISLERWNYHFYEYLERRGEPMTLRITRGGKPLTLTFPPTVVIP